MRLLWQVLELIVYKKMRLMMRLMIFLMFLSFINLQAQYLLTGPMLGHTDDKSAKIWCSLDQVGSVQVHISEDESLKNARVLNFDNFEIGALEIDGLKPSTQYTYQLKASKYSKSPYFNFITAPKQGSPGKLRFMFSSCSGHAGYDEDLSWLDITKMDNLDLLFQLGDNHYADTTDPKVITKHYINHRSLTSFRSATAKTPTYGIWDDHDFGPNNSDGQTPGKEASLEIFKKHWANPSFGESDNPGIYTTFHYGDVQFILLDSRYHRTPNKSMKVSDPAKKLLGDKQFDWLKRSLEKSQAKIKVVACGSEFQMDSTSDCFSGFKVEQNKVLDLFKSTPGVILISGDRHFTGAYHVRGETLEVTSGPLGSGNARPRMSKDTIFRETQGKMFSVFELDTAQNPPQIILEVYRSGHGQIRKQSFSWDQINGKKAIK
jgi:alkaline phosphatase D